jgi:hypothetical protein
MKKFINRIKNGWLLFARTLGRVSTIILLTLIYLLVIGPMALYVKILGKDLLQKKNYAAKTSYWRDRVSSEPTIERHKFQF